MFAFEPSHDDSGDCADSADNTKEQGSGWPLNGSAIFSTKIGPKFSNVGFGHKQRRTAYNVALEPWAGCC
jgi:hypothetical protein